MMRRSWLLVTVLAASVAAPAAACPFCGTVAASLAERRDAAAEVAVAVAHADAGPDANGRLCQRFRLDQVLRGRGAAKPGDVVQAEVTEGGTGTAVLFGQPGNADRGEPALRWSAVPADETVLGYVAAAPPITAPAAERLRWFARRLEHPEPTIAADAFAEFGRADFTAVRAAADACNADDVRSWVTDPGRDGRRRGLYGLLLGVVAATAHQPAASRACVETLEAAITAPVTDFRAGFDGIMAGLLVAEGDRGLETLRRHGLFAADARTLDQKHLLAALRFAWESLGDSIDRRKIVAATAELLDRPAVAADAVTDLARYAAWDRCEPVARLWDRPDADDPLIRRAVAGYLTVCPLPDARRTLERLRERDPDRLGRAVEAARLPPAR